MISIRFPNMLSSQKANLVEDRDKHDATYQNLKYLLLSDKLSMFGDPYYGTNIKRFLYSQTKTLKDILIDDIYTAIGVFMPQIAVSRNDINLYAKYQNVYVTLSCTNRLDHVTNLYSICLTSTETI